MEEKTWDEPSERELREEEDEIERMEEARREQNHDHLQEGLHN